MRDVAAAGDPRTEQPIRTILPSLLAERSMSLRALGRAANVDVAHLSRLLAPASSSAVSTDLVRRITRALDLPAGYFPEEREAQVIDAIRRDGKFRDRLFDELNRR